VRRVRFVLVAALTAGCAGLPKALRARDVLSADEHARLGAAYEEQGGREAALAQYRLALATDPRNEGAWMALGNHAFRDGDLKKAERCYRRVLRLEPDHAGAANNLAMVYLSQGRRLDEARDLARGALARGGPLEPYILDTLERIERARPSATP
jgi:Tfp pilus assembly protein PilF